MKSPFTTTLETLEGEEKTVEALGLRSPTRLTSPSTPSSTNSARKHSLFNASPPTFRPSGVATERLLPDAHLQHSSSVTAAATRPCPVLLAPKPIKRPMLPLFEENDSRISLPSSTLASGNNNVGVKSIANTTTNTLWLRPRMKSSLVVDAMMTAGKFRTSASSFNELHNSMSTKHHFRHTISPDNCPVSEGCQNQAASTISSLTSRNSDNKNCSFLTPTTPSGCYRDVLQASLCNTILISDSRPLEDAFTTPKMEGYDFTCDSKITRAPKRRKTTSLLPHCSMGTPLSLSQAVMPSNSSCDSSKGAVDKKYWAGPPDVAPKDLNMHSQEETCHDKHDAFFLATPKELTTRNGRRRCHAPSSSQWILKPRYSQYPRSLSHLEVRSATTLHL